MGPVGTSGVCFCLFFSLKFLICGYSVVGAAVLFLQLFHNDGEERPANIDQGQEISSGIYGMGQFYRN